MVEMTFYQSPIRCPFRAYVVLNRRIIVCMYGYDSLIEEDK
jgi:hypothetical protein